MLIQNMAFVVVFELHRTCSRSLSGCIGHGFLLVKCLCPKQVESNWHDIKCLRGECVNCGFHLLPLCICEVDPGNQSPVAW
jgi:hypothetical protein